MSPIVKKEGICIVVLIETLPEKKVDVRNNLFSLGIERVFYNWDTLGFYTYISNLHDVAIKKDIEKIDGVQRVLFKDICVRCQMPTEYDISTPIDERIYYVEGNGQWCNTCYARSSKVTYIAAG